ncbi:hypothetical protein CK203_072678 [Vitis vinifera]|uniref:Uncharacterized protein n=1 Tax=Vitis vinifera TaxID=29760 RepID=A0A438EZ57_VITVI|nr:hypothetical protein CK203_072678 [Vitis vinifera]
METTSFPFIQSSKNSLPATLPASLLSSLPFFAAMRSTPLGLASHQIRPFTLPPVQPKPNTPPLHPPNQDQDDGIPVDLVKILVKFKSRHNYIRVLDVSRKADHPFAGSRLLILDGPGNIHSISFLLKSFTDTYFDVLATLPAILPPGPLGILGFGAGSAARLILETYPQVVVHGWELDPSVIEVGREYFGLSKLEKEHPIGFSSTLFDTGASGSRDLGEVEEEVEEGGRIMVNVGGSCVEAEDSRRDGKVVMEESLKAMHKVFGDQVFVLNLGNRKEDSSIALTGELPDLDEWKKALPRSLRGQYLLMAEFEAGVESLECNDLLGNCG